MTIAAVLCVLIGTFPTYTVYALLPWESTYQPYDLTHVLTQLQLLFFSALAFVWLNLRNMYPPELRSTNIDADWLYRKVAPAFITRIATATFGLYERQEKAAIEGVKRLIRNSYDVEKGQPKGYFGKLWPTETMVFWVAILLSGYLVLYYV